MSCLGDLERGRGDLWQVNLAGHTRGWIWHVSMARHFGGSVWRVCLAGQFGSFIWRVFTSNEKDMLLSKKKKQKSNEMYYGESVDCNAIMQPVIQCYCSRCRFSRTSKLWSCNRGYVDLWIILRMEINIMKKKLDLISVVLRCYCIPCIGQVTFKGCRKLVLATCCQEFTIEEFLATQLRYTSCLNFDGFVYGDVQ